MSAARTARIGVAVSVLPILLTSACFMSDPPFRSIGVRVDQGAVTLTMALCPDEHVTTVELTSSEDESSHPRVQARASRMTELGNGLAEVEFPMSSLPPEVDVWIETDQAAAGTGFAIADVPTVLAPGTYWVDAESGVDSAQELRDSADCG